MDLSHGVSFVNPVDILSYITYQLSGFPPERVIGSGTVLDTSRLRYILSQDFNVDARNIHTYIMGEHGDSEIAAWSLTSVAGMHLNEYCNIVCMNCNDSYRKKTVEDVRNAAYEVIDRKGSTYYAIALAIRKIVETILRDENSILTVSSLLKGEYGISDIYMGIPSIVGSNGVKKVLQIPLNQKETFALKTSAETLKSTLTNSGIKLF